jgi:hypothetical protein
MNKLSTFVRNPFSTIEVSRDDFQKFVYDHIQRSKVPNSVAFAPFIAETETQWTGLFGNLHDYDLIFNEQQSFTKQVNLKMNEFLTKAIGMDPHILIKFGKKSGTYQEFYPFGHAEYHNATQANILILMERMISVSHKYATELGATWETEYTTLHTEFLTLFAAQKAKKGGVKIFPSDYEAKEAILCNQLYKNMCIILGEYYRTPEKMLDFFDETIVNYVSHIHKMTVPKNSSKASDISFAFEDNIVARNKTAKALKYYFAPTADTPTPSTTSDLPPLGEVIITGLDAGAPANKVMIFVNESDMDANVEVLLK